MHPHILQVLAQVQEFQTPPIEWYAVVPELILVGGALLLMVVAALTPKPLPRGTYAWATVAIAAATLIDASVLWSDVQHSGPTSVIAGALGLDGFSVFFIVVTCVALILGSLFADSQLRRSGITGCEPYVLMLLSATGAIVMASANDLIVLFLGLETLSIALYVLAASDLPSTRVSGSRDQVLRPRRHVVGVPPLRHRLRVRRHRLDEPRRDPGLPEQERAARKRR